MERETEDPGEARTETGHGLCPSCGARGKAVGRITVEALLTEEALGRLASPDGLRFCRTPSCEVAYFRPGTGERFGRRDLRVRIGLKETEAPRPLCYCFGYRVEEVEAEVASTGASRIAGEIADRCRRGLDRCAETNPQGSCCLGNVREVVEGARARAGITGAEGFQDCCVEEGT